MASFTGNISEWEWTRDNTTDAYSLEYDALSRITGSRLFRNGNPVDALSESGISYDSNGNILSLTRTGEDGSAVNDLSYHYDGNRLTSLSDGDIQFQNYAYDADGNMTFDGRTGMSLTWNDLGLVEKVSLNDTDLVNYSYLADGTKVSALDGDGDGLLYFGSLIYKKTGDSIELESAGFAGGRFVARETEDDGKVMVPMIHVTDHLGNVRTVVDITDIQRWTTPDPLAEKYYDLSPYAFCNNNPINFVDPDGEAIYHMNSNGHIICVDTTSTMHQLYLVDNDGRRTDIYIDLTNSNILEALADKKGIASYTSSSNIDDFFKVFLFASDNSNVEWALHRGQDNSYTIGTKHDKGSAGTWEDYGIKKPIASVHSHPDEPNSFYYERCSMSHDYDNVTDEVEKYGQQMRLNYVYFPNSTRLYHVEPSGVRYIHSVNNNYRRFYFGTLNHR